jgi:hypothetical protein
MKKLGLLLAIALMLGTASVALAQNVGDGSVYFVTYFSNANTAKAPDATVRTVNDGDTGGNLWAAYYVFDDSQELSECGACFVSPDGVNSESVNAELTANPLTGRYLSRGVIKMISSSTPDPTATKPTSGLRPWSTHIQKLTSTTFAVTETKFADANLSAGEQTLLQNLCYYAQILGSGTGVITCTPEDHDF